MNCRRLPPAKELPEAMHKDIERISRIWQECRQRYGDKGPELSAGSRLPMLCMRR
jgi:glutathione S-transferase